MKVRLVQFSFFLAVLIASALCQASTIILTNTSSNFTINRGSDVRIYGTESSNQITLESGAKAELLNSPGKNFVHIQANSNLFTVSRSGATVRFQGTDGTFLKIPASTEVQTISFNGEENRVLQISYNQVMLDDQVIGTANDPILSSDILPKSLPSSYIGLFLPVSPIKNNTKYVAQMASKAVDYNIDVINLNVDWNDLEVSKNSYDFDSLFALLNEIHAKNIKCKLRIYFNKEEYGQVIPYWFLAQLNPSNSYVYKGVINVLPWYTDYQTLLTQLLKKMSTYFINKERLFPDGIDISVGGEFGEMNLWHAGINWYDGWPGPEFTNWEKLVIAEKQHIDFFKSYLSVITNDFTIMINSMWNRPEDIEKELTIPNYAISKGYRWIQVNCSACFLDESEYALDNINMLVAIKRQNPSIKLSLEDENTRDCNVNSGSISSRLSILRRVQFEYGLKFNAIILGKEDLVESNRTAISELRNYINNYSSIQRTEYPSDKLP